MIKYATLIALFFISLPCYAQDNEDNKRFEGGFILGANITNVTGNTYTGFHKVGLNTGGVVYIHFNTTWGVSMEMLYVNKGARGAHETESLALGTYFDKYYLNLNYIEVPVLVHLKKFSFFDFEGGFAYSRLLKSKEWAAADVPVFFDPELTWFNKEEMSILLGATMPLGERWYGNMRLQSSLAPVRPWNRVLPRYSDYTNQRNNVVSFRLIYML